MESDRQREKGGERQRQRQRELNTENLSMKSNDEHQFSCVKLKV